MEPVRASASSTRRRWRVCDPKRINQHRVFAADAKRGKSSMGWFFGFKLHLAVNDRGDLLACCLTPGTIDDRKPVLSMVKKLRGKLFGDRGYISAPLTTLLFEQGLQLITRLRKNMRKSADASVGQTSAA
jgi:Transposase DDE domain